MRYVLCITILILGQYSAANAAPLELDYSINYQQQTITLEFAGDVSGQTAIILPNDQYGNKNLYQELTNITVDGAKAFPTEYEYIKLLQHEPKNKLKISYNFALSSKKLPVNLNQARKALLEKSYFHIIGATLLVIPVVEEDNEIICSMHWTLPENWEFASSFGINKEQQSYSGKIEGLVNALFIGGDFRMNLKKIHDKDVCIAIRGKWPFTDNSLVLNLVKIISLEREFWNDINHPFFLVSAIPIYQQENIISGLGLKNAFCLFIAEKQAIDANLKRLLVHEYFHSWNTPKLFTKQSNNQIEFLWFTEGFTDYYTDLLGLRAQVITLQEYLENYNKTLMEYFTSTALNIPNNEIKNKFWQNYDYNKIAYQRGYILAHNWNATIKLGTKNNKKSLDHVMQELVKHYNEINKQTNIESSNKQNINNEQNLEPTTLTAKYITKTVSNFANQNVEQDFENYIEEGKTIYPHPQSLGKCTNYKVYKYAIVEPGFDIRSSALIGKITNVSNDSAAFAAGLRNDQNILNIKYNPIDSKIPITVSIKEDDNSKTIKYYSNEIKSFNIPQFSLDEKLIEQNPAECLAWFGEIKHEW